MWCIFICFDTVFTWKQHTQNTLKSHEKLCFWHSWLSIHSCHGPQKADSVLVILCFPPVTLMFTLVLPLVGHAVESQFKNRQSTELYEKEEMKKGKSYRLVEHRTQRKEDVRGGSRNRKENVSGGRMCKEMLPLPPVEAECFNSTFTFRHMLSGNFLLNRKQMGTKNLNCI